MSPAQLRSTVSSAPREVPISRVGYALLTAALGILLAYLTVTNGAWAAAGIGLVAPDLALLFGAGRNLGHGQLHPRAVGVYNAVPRFWGPAVLIAVAATGVLDVTWL